jgi:uncharacterized membrane protein YbhN (UPF0104 family)
MRRDGDRARMGHVDQGSRVEPSMSGTVAVGDADAPARDGTGHPVRRIVLIVAMVVGAGAAASLLGWDIRGWFERLWDTITTLSAGYIVAAVIAQTVKTTATAYAWYAILTYAYPREGRFRVVFASYATCVALNCILPANLGTIVMFVMLTTVIASATFAGMIGGFLVQKIFFSLAACFVWLYLFLTVPGSFDISFEFVKDNPWALVALLVAGAVVLVIAIRSFWPRVLKWWEQAKDGGQILAHPGAYFGRVFLPEFVAWVSGLVIVGVFMAAYSIPVTFHSVMAVTGSNSVSNTVSVTPGGAGVNQAFNVAALSDVTDATTATAYSLSQQIVTTAWSLLFALVLMLWVFGWGGGKALLEHSYTEAKRRAEEQKAALEAKKGAE